MHMYFSKPGYVVMIRVTVERVLVTEQSHRAKSVDIRRQLVGTINHRQNLTSEMSPHTWCLGKHCLDVDMEGQAFWNPAGSNLMQNSTPKGCLAKFYITKLSVLLAGSVLCLSQAYQLTRGHGHELAGPGIAETARKQRQSFDISSCMSARLPIKRLMSSM